MPLSKVIIWIRRALQKKNCKSLDICPKQPYPTYLYPLVWTKFSLDINFSAYPTYLSNKFGHFGIRVCSWRRCQKHPDRGVPSFLWGYRAFSVSLGGVFTIYKSLRGVRDHFKNFQGRFWNFAYFYKYGHQYLTYLPQFFLSKLFFRKKVWLGNTLPTYGLDICPNFCSFFWKALLRGQSVVDLEKVSYPCITYIQK